jgi:hypothetical protein
MNHTGLDQSVADILNFDVSDDALEAAAMANAKANPTAPFAIICIPFAPANRKPNRVA